MALFRSAMKQVARRHGYLVSLMCRLRLPLGFASGWHLHQSLLDRKSGKNLFVSDDATEPLSPLGRRFLRVCSRMRVRRRRSPRRPSTATSAITASTRWRRSRRSGRRDNRGVMIRALGEPGDRDASGEPRRRAARQSVSLHGSQIHAGLDGIARKLMPGPSADAPYEISAEPLPQSLAEALAALKVAPVSAPASATLSWTISSASSRPRSRAARPRPRDNPATPPMSAIGSTGNISISPDEGREMSPGRRCCGAQCASKTGSQTLCHFEPFLWRRNHEKSRSYQIHIWLTERKSGARLEPPEMRLLRRHENERRCVCVDGVGCTGVSAR